MTKKTTKTKGYTATIKVMGNTYTSKGQTAREAVEKLKPSGVARGVSIVTISDGKSSREKVLNTFQTARLFSPSRLAREIALKNIFTLLDL